VHGLIAVRHEGKRGCGWRKVGGIYLVGADLALPCGRLPIPLTTCPCCGSGFKPSRGWTWVDADRLILTVKDVKCRAPVGLCRACIITRIAGGEEIIGQAGLLWIGEQFYPTPEHFTREAAEMGISRRIASVPNEFKVGKTWVLMAHRKALTHFRGFQGIGPGDDRPAGLTPPEFTPGIFRIWKPERIEIVVDGTEEDEVIEGYLKRGLSPIKVERIEAQKEMPL